MHGLHPHDVQRRVSDALDSVRPYLGSHGGDVDLLDVPTTGVVRLQFAGSCKSCPSSAVTLELAVEDAVRAAAPEISSIEVGAAETTRRPAVIPAESLLAHVHANGHPDRLARRCPSSPSCAAARSAASGRGTAVLACRVGDAAVRLPGPLPGAATARWPARAAPRDGSARVPCCVVRAVTRISTSCMPAPASTVRDCHLDPMPLLMRDGVLSLAVVAGDAAGASA